MGDNSVERSGCDWAGRTVEGSVQLMGNLSDQQSVDSRASQKDNPSAGKKETLSERTKGFLKEFQRENWKVVSLVD